MFQRRLAAAISFSARSATAAIFLSPYGAVLSATRAGECTAGHRGKTERTSSPPSATTNARARILATYLVPRRCAFTENEILELDQVLRATSANRYVTGVTRRFCNSISKSTVAVHHTARGHVTSRRSRVARFLSLLWPTTLLAGDHSCVQIPEPDPLLHACACHRVLCAACAHASHTAGAHHAAAVSGP